MRKFYAWDELYIVTLTKYREEIKPQNNITST